MLLQTNSYIVPKDKRTEHARLLQRFRQCLARLGCEHFEAYEQVGANWSGSETTGRFVQLMRFRDRKQQQQVQAAERSDPQAQALIKEFCELINFPYQQQQGLFAVGFYQGIISLASPLRQPPPGAAAPPAESSDPGTDPATGSPQAEAGGASRPVDEDLSLELNDFERPPTPNPGDTDASGLTPSAPDESGHAPAERAR